MNATLPAFVSTLGWALVHFVWQGTLVGIATAIALLALRNARPQTRYAVCCAALALCLALPIVGVWRGMQSDAAVAGTPITSALATNAADPVVLPDHASVTLSASWRSSLQGQLPWIVALWSLGAGLLAARMALGMMWVGRIGRSRTGASHPRWQRRLDRLAEKLGIERMVRLRVTPDLASPVAAGCWKPMVLVPAALIANMPLDLLEALLAHELAHIKRHDYLVNLIQSAIESLLFYHPVVWWLSKQIRIEREQIADDIAACALGEPHRLALALHELDVFQQDQLQRLDDFTGAIQLVPAANGGHLMSRIQRLIRPNQHALDWKMALPIIGMATFCLTVYARDSSPALARSSEASMASAVAMADASTARPTLNSSAYRIATLAPVLARASTLAHDSLSASSAIARATAMAHAAAAMPVLADIRIAKATDNRGDAYALVRADHDGMTMSGDTRDIPQIEGARKKVHGDFIWVRHNGRTYIVQDPAVIARAVDAWKTTEPIEKQMQALEDQMKVPEQRMEALDKQMEELSNEKSPAHVAMEKYQAQMEPLQNQVEAIGRKMEAIGDKMEDANATQRETLQRQMDALQQQMAPLSAQMEKLGALMEQQGKQIEASMAPMEKLGKQMEAESKPMEALGKQMEALGKQEEALSKEADRKIQALIEEAMRSGKAAPTENIIQRD
jgi:beta-lactamase regulating signal transducer with metallopeptidase domain/predicted  nucleic acid-binding Zn-ribbon protein